MKYERSLFSDQTIRKIKTDFFHVEVTKEHDVINQMISVFN